MDKLKKYCDNVVHATKILFAASGKYFLLQLLITLIEALLPYAPLFLWRKLLNTLTEYIFGEAENHISTIVVFTVLYCTVRLISETIGTVSRLISYKYNDAINYYLDNVLIDKTSEIDLAFFDSSALRDKLNYTTRHMRFSTQNMVSVMFSLLQSIIWLAVSIVVISQLTLPLVIVIILLSIPSIVGDKNIQKRNYEFEKTYTKAERKLQYYQSLFFGETLQEMKLYNLKNYFSGLYGKQWEQWRAAKNNKNVKACIINCMTSVLMAVGEIIVYVVTISRLVSGLIGVGDVTYYVSILTQFRTRFSGLFHNFNNFKQISIRFDDVRAFVEMEPLLEKSGELIPSKLPKIEFKNVSFKYPNAENYVLKDCSFTIEYGETAGLVGLNGAGKSTVVKLICRFYDPVEGQVLIDGIDSREYDIAKLRALYSVLFQDFCTYSFTLRESIALSDLPRMDNDEDILEACKKSNVADFIIDWENGIDEELTRQFVYGKELSNGQWQRVALARTFFKDAPVVLLDEPSAALDPIAEHDIFTKFSQLSDKKSALLISHRLSSITLANKILVLEDGHIIEQGSHQELLDKNGRYAYLFNLQASKYLKDES